MRRRTVIIGLWLLIVAALIFGMVVLGGATRLTHSGLSMVQWEPLTGWWPPIGAAAWEEVFAAYKRYPEYQQINPGMSLAGFKEVFWLEYLHRLLGRLIGVVFLLPFLFFLAKGWIDRRLGAGLAVLFVLGGLQAALGWYMVESGLVDRPDVSQYRLVAHLGVALVLYGSILWIAFGLLSPQAYAEEAPRWSRSVTAAMCGLVMLTALTGGFVAGTDAGFAYNTFPTMDGDLVPRPLLALQPWYLNFFENPATVQFAHRFMATATLTGITIHALLSRVRVSSGRVRRALNILLIAALAQYALGIATLLHAVPLPLGIAHQAGAVLLWTAVLWAGFALRRVRRSGQVGAETYKPDRRSGQMAARQAT